MDINEIIRQVTQEVCSKYAGDGVQAGGAEMSAGSLA